MLTEQFELTKENKNKILRDLEEELIVINKYMSAGLAPAENKKIMLLKNAYQSAVMITKDIVD